MTRVGIALAKPFMVGSAWGECSKLHVGRELRYRPRFLNGRRFDGTTGARNRRDQRSLRTRAVKPRPETTLKPRQAPVGRLLKAPLEGASSRRPLITPVPGARCAVETPAVQKTRPV